MIREFTRRRRDKGTQVNKRPAHTNAAKYSEKRVGLLRVLIMSDLQEGTFIKKQNLLTTISQRALKFRSSIPPFIYECLRKVEELEPTIECVDGEILGNYYTNLLCSSNLFYVFEKSLWITCENISLKSLRFLFHKEFPKEVRVSENFSMKDLPLKIQDFEIFKGTPPIAVLNLGSKLIGMTVSSSREEQKQLFNYQLNSKAEKYVIQKDSLFILLRNGTINFGKIGQELDELDDSKAKFQQLRLCGSDVMVVTKSYVIKILALNGTPKKVIRAGVEISNVIPIYISTNMYVLLAEQEGKTCLLNCYKGSKNNYLQACPEGLERIEQTYYVGKWILLRTQKNTIYVFALLKDRPVKIYEVYNGTSANMLKILHKKLLQT